MMEACQPLYSSKLSFRRATNQGRSLSRSSRQEGRGGRGTHPSHAASTCGLPHGCHGVMTSLLASRLGGLFRGLVAGETVQRPSQSSRGGKNGPVATQACPSETGPIFDGSFPRLVAAVEAHRVAARARPNTLKSGMPNPHGSYLLGRWTEIAPDEGYFHVSAKCYFPFNVL
jgi:hypothetical protein